MTPNDKKTANCSSCEFYYNKIDASSSPLGWCRNGYGRAIHTLVMCPKLAAKLAAKKEKEANDKLNPKTTPTHVPKVPFKTKKVNTAKKKNVPVKAYPAKAKPVVTVVVKAKKVMEPSK